MNLESIILNDLFNMLNSLNANYCVMNNYENMPEVIPSDVDIAVDLKTYYMLDSLVMKLARKHDVSITQKIWHGYHKCAYILSPLHIDSYFWLQLDFFVDFGGRGFPNLLPGDVMLSKKRKYKNFYIPQHEVEIPFLLLRRIFKGDIEEKHIVSLVKLYNMDIDSAKKGIMDIFGAETGQALIAFIESKDINNFKLNYSYYRKQLKRISSKNTDFKYRIKYTIWQFIRTIYRFYYPTGLSIAFIGKNTFTKREFINSFDERISGSFHGVTHFTPKNIGDYVKGMLLKDYWSKVTKRKTLWNLDTSTIDWRSIFSNKVFKLLLPVPDVLIYIYDTSEEIVEDTESTHFVLNQNQEHNEQIMKECLYVALNTQSSRTKRHLMDWISPTAKTKVWGDHE